MNKNNLAHSYIQNQQPASWTDDPFDLKGTFTGVKRLNHQQQLAHFAQELVIDYAIFDGHQYTLLLKDLSDYDQNELVRLFMENTGRETSECVYGGDFSDNNAYTCALLAMLKNDCHGTRLDFAEITRKNTINYYSKSLQHTLDEACHDYWCAVNAEQGYYSQQDNESGEIVWGKF